MFANLLDRYLHVYLSEHNRRICKEYFNLLSVTIFQLAIKLECSYDHPLLGTMAHLSRNQFSEWQIAKMEMQALTTLSWKLHPPTAASFLDHFSLLLRSQFEKSTPATVLDSAQYSIELAVMEYKLSVEYEQYSIAMAALLNALVELSAVDSSLMERFSLLLDLIDPNLRDKIDRCRSYLRLLRGRAAKEVP